MKLFKNLFTAPKKQEVFIEDGLQQILYMSFVARTGLFPNEQLVTMNKKITWSMMFDVTDEKRLCADKYKARGYVAEKIGDKYLPTELGAWTGPLDIDFDALPENFLLRLNVGAGKNRLVTNKSKLDIDALKDTLHRWFAPDYAFKSFEMQYYKTKKILFALQPDDLQEIEMKAFVFHGKVQYIQATMYSKEDRTIGTKVFDADWNEQDFYMLDFKIPHDIPRPEYLNELIEKSETLADGFDFIRVDWDITKQGELRFKEFVFSPQAGNIPFHPLDANNIMGSHWTIPLRKQDGTIRR